MENTRDIKDNTRELLEAIDDGNIEVVKEILRNKMVDINGCDYRGITPLMCAVDDGNIEIVEEILRNKMVDINVYDDRGDTPLMCAG